MLAHVGSCWDHVGSRWLQIGPKMAQGRSTLLQVGTKVPLVWLVLYCFCLASWLFKNVGFCQTNMFKKYGLPGRGKYWCPPPFILLHNRSFQGGTISRTYLHDKIILIMHGTNENKYKTKQNRGATLFPTLDNTLQGGY